MEFFIERENWAIDAWVVPESGAMCALGYYATQRLGVTPEDLLRWHRAALPTPLSPDFIDEIILLNDCGGGEQEMVNAFARKGIKLEFID